MDWWLVVVLLFHNGQTTILESHAIDEAACYREMVAISRYVEEKVAEEKIIEWNILCEERPYGKKQGAMPPDVGQGEPKKNEAVFHPQANRLLKD